jgi:hypothetical protein
MAHERVLHQEKVAVRMSPRCKEIATSSSRSEKHSAARSGEVRFFGPVVEEVFA